MNRIISSFAALTLSIATSATENPVEIKIDVSQKFQKIHQMGASDAWSGFCEKWTSKEQAAKLLFSRGFDASGNPEGIGLSLWRVNLGAGTENGDITPATRRQPSFLGSDGKYDWSKCAEQQYFMMKAREYGCNNFILFSNSPLIQYTKNGKGYAPDDSLANIRPECYKLYADYMRDVAEHFVREGYTVTGISAINEPSVNWSRNRQEGSSWRISEMKRMYTELDRALGERAATDGIQIIVGEFPDLKTLYSLPEKFVKRFTYADAPAFGVPRFFDPDSAACVAGLRHVRPQIAAHCYHEGKTFARIIETREKTAEICKRYGVEYHMTEWCMLPSYFHKNLEGIREPYDEGNGTTLEIALHMARIMWADFTIGQACEWTYWKGMENGGFYSLVALNPDSKDNLTAGGTVKANKNLWVFGNYSRFIRPGYRRVRCDGAESLGGLVASAFISPDGKSLSVILVNSSEKEIPARLKSAGRRLRFNSAYLTSDTSDLKRLPSDCIRDGVISVPSRSVCTLVYGADIR